MADILVATTSVLTTVNGRDVYIHKGATVREGHPILDGREHLFTLLVPTFEVEAPKPAAPAKPKSDSAVKTGTN